MACGVSGVEVAEEVEETYTTRQRVKVEKFAEGGVEVTLVEVGIP